MALSRQRQRELKRLKRDAEHLWDEQREAIEHATAVLKDARRQAANFAREEVRPRVRDGIGAARDGFGVARDVASTARERFTDDVLPAISGTIGSALAVLEAAKNPAVRDVVRRVTKAGQKVGVVTPPKSAGPGRYIAIAVGVVALAGIAYAAWQTLRADDDLWIEDLGDPGSADIGDDDEF
jgi:hypothetical protein